MRIDKRNTFHRGVCAVACTHLLTMQMAAANTPPRRGAPVFRGPYGGPSGRLPPSGRPNKPSGLPPSVATKEPTVSTVHVIHCTFSSLFCCGNTMR